MHNVSPKNKLGMLINVMLITKLYIMFQYLKVNQTSQVVPAWL